MSFLKELKSAKEKWQELKLGKAWVLKLARNARFFKLFHGDFMYLSNQALDMCICITYIYIRDIIDIIDLDMYIDRRICRYVYVDRHDLLRLSEAKKDAEGFPFPVWAMLSTPQPPAAKAFDVYEIPVKLIIGQEELSVEAGHGRLL